MGMNGSTMLEPLRQGLPPLDPSTVSNAASCALPTRYEAVREARQFTRRTLDQWDIGDRFDDICLVVSELVTNAVQATRRLDAAALPSVKLRLTNHVDHVLIEVADQHPRTPESQPSSPDLDHGRGLTLVAAFSTEWGCYTAPGTPGKVVWAKVAK